MNLSERVDVAGQNLVRLLKRLAPGVVLAVAVAATASILSQLMPLAVGSVLPAVIIGLAISNTLSLPASLDPGLKFVQKRVLRLGIVLLGARLTFTEILSIGLPSLGIILVCFFCAFASVAVLGKIAGIPVRLAVLIGVGTAICGNSAIMASAPTINARDREVAFAVGTITVFGTTAMLVFPIVAHLVGMPEAVFGLWAGLSINDTSQVVAAGAAYSPISLEVATVVKLVRNILMAPTIVFLAAWVSFRQDRGSGGSGSIAGAVAGAFPVFILGFLSLAVLRSFGVLTEFHADLLTAGATWAITIALAGIGLSTRVKELASVGPRPLVVGFGASIILAVLGLTFASLVGSAMVSGHVVVP